MYEGFFGLSDVPFRLTPDPRFLYLSPKHAEALAHLRLGLTEPGGFVCITGDIGAGKTTVLRTFLDGLGADVSTAFIFNPTLSWDDLLQRIARELGVPGAATSGVDVMDALNAHLLAERRAGRVAIVVIDEAQAMPRDVLERVRLLSNLETSTEKLLRLVLVGQPELARVLLDPALAQLNQRITLRWHLAPLTRAETAAYVRHRLTVAGCDGAADLFTRPALHAVHYYSGGVPRLVNMIAHRATLVAYVHRERRVGLSAVRDAYREIRRVPLAATGRRRRLAWASSAMAAGLALAMIAMPRGNGDPNQVIAGEPASPAVAPVPPAAVPVAPTALPLAAPARRAIAPAAVGAAGVPSADLEGRLAGLDPLRSLSGALDAVLAAWDAERLRADERLTVDALGDLALRRGLESLRLTGNLSMLRLLDLPAVLELRSPATEAPVYAALVAIDDSTVTLQVGNQPMAVAYGLLDRVWQGGAHVLWRDFESLGPTFGDEARGEHVARLQRLLARSGVYAGAPTGRFDADTEAAVLAFQRSRRLDPDCRVGRLTRIALYGAAGGYGTPTLAARPGTRGTVVAAHATGDAS